jgi:predicted enzyme related to lactoylglutathione lyase
VSVTETFFAVDVQDMERAREFYGAAFGAEVAFVTPNWTSLRIAGARVALARSDKRKPRQVGLHFRVSDLASARAAVKRSGGAIVWGPTKAAPGVVLLGVTDTEGNTFTLVSSRVGRAKRTVAGAPR